jgi:adenosylcobinamide-GDP ribazoletransferase
VALSDIGGGLRGAVGFLTRLPVSTTEEDWDRFRTFPATFPIVGYLIGAIAAVPFVLAAPTASTAFGYLLVLVGLVGIPHLDGIADLGDAVAAHGDDSRRRALKDTTTGVGAVVAITVVVAGLLLAALELAGFPPLVAVGTVVAAEVGAKLGMATVACLGTASHEGLGSAFTRGAEPALLIGPILVSLPAALFVGAFPATVVTVAVGPLVAAGLVRWADRTLGGVNGDIFGAVNELGRLFGLHVGVIAWTLS